jgi:phage tail sheath gpL-like
MSNATLLISVKTVRPQAGISVKPSSQPWAACREIEKYFEKIMAGLEPASFTICTSANAPVAASGTCTIVNGSVTANDTVTVAGTVLTAKTSGATGAQFNIGASGTITAANLAAAINANQKIVSATSSGAVVTITCNTPGAVGNFVTLATSHSGAFTLSGSTLASGAGGAETTPVSYSRGL